MSGSYTEDLDNAKHCALMSVFAARELREQTRFIQDAGGSAPSGLGQEQEEEEHPPGSAAHPNP